MSRSVKKGPFVQEKLFAAIVEMNNKNEKKVVKTWSRSSTIFPEFIGHPLLFTMAESMFRYTLPRIWSATSWASSLSPAPSRAIPVLRPLTANLKGGN